MSYAELTQAVVELFLIYGIDLFEHEPNNIHLTEKAYDIQRWMDMVRKKLDKTLTLGMNKKEIEALEKMTEAHPCSS